MTDQEGEFIIHLLSNQKVIFLVSPLLKELPTIMIMNCSGIFHDDALLVDTICIESEEELLSLCEFYESDPIWGPIKWVIKKRNQPPCKRIAARLLEEGISLL